MTSQNALHRVSRGATGAWKWVGRIPTRLQLALRDYQDTRTEAMALREGPSVAERQAAIVEFYVEYEHLVEVLCDAAQYGPDVKLQSAYERLREWMQVHYPPLRNYVVAYLRYDPMDAQKSMDWHGMAGDAFESLFAAQSLDDFLRLDDGHMIWRIERTRNALNLYANHLRQLAEKEKECG